ncbi:MAG: WecB/TagA/CpsF family glycosyltransferase, partial [Candidatus Moraniibacteriota bacterium]
MRILGVEIDNLSRTEIISRVDRFLDEPKFHQIATVNPEFLVEADRNPEFRNVLNQCDMRVADGFGIALVSFFRGEKLKCRFPGADLMEEILRMADEKNLSVYLAVRADGLSSYGEIKSVLLGKYPGLQIGGG